MTPLRLAYWLVFAAAMAVYMTMILWTLPAIAEAAGGLRPLDLRPAGYGAGEARAFLETLSDQGRALYLGPQRMLDSVYPALLATVLAGAAIALIGNRVLRTLVIVLSLGGMLADYTENARVAAMLMHPNPVPDMMIAAANRATVTKSALTALAMSGVLLGLIVAGWRRWRP